MQGQIIVLDGPDAVGKTTLAEAFLKKYPDTKYLHLIYRWKDKIFDYHTAAMKLAGKWAMTHNVIIDRWWPTEACYASVYRNTSAWPLQGRFHERVALKYGAVYVLCLPDEKTISRHERLKKERDEMYDNIDDLCKLYHKLYYGDKKHIDKGNYIDQLILSGGLEDTSYYIPYTIDRWGAHLNTFTEMVMHVASKMREMQWLDALTPSEQNILGHRQFAKYLLVGDQVNPKYKNIFWPFFEYGNSSLYLTEAMHKMWLKERDFIWTNSRDHTGKPDVKFIRAAKEEKIKVIALGTKALGVMNEFGINPDACLHHPQWYKRFNGWGFQGIIDDIEGVL
tara:strand:+ start:767 stop:1777 length:1011 start_codon:yes stop_codon:yes gene_type:complete